VRTVPTGHGPREAATIIPRIGLARTADWELVDPDCRQAIEDTAECARAAGAQVTDIVLPSSVEALSDAHRILHSFEAARALAYERTSRPDELSTSLREILTWGAAIPAADYEEVRQRATRARASADRLFADVDVLLTPAVVGEAPEGCGSTGDPRFDRLWTTLGVPSLNVPGLCGATGLPVGVQLVGRPSADGQLLVAGEWLGRLLS
jgi:Asp-tRNA(Asn)/Glu-tRNA(Gln) amidotransferase A subunit family amidase